MIIKVDMKHDKPFILFALFAVFALSLLLQNQFSLRHSLLFLTGTAFGYTLLHAAYGFSGAWRQFIRNQHSRGFRSHILLFMLTSLLFFPIIGELFPGIKAAAALAPVGISVLVGAFLFGIGMQMGSGCGSGTLYTVGGGHVNMLITLSFFIIGATVGSVHLPWWLSLPSAGKISVIEHFGWLPSLIFQLMTLLVIYKLLSTIEKRRHGSVQPLLKPREKHASLDTFLFGPWPLWWAVIALALLNLLTLLIAGHPWTITFAFGLWGTKIWTALGGDISGWLYWSRGYPASALDQSLLNDTTSLMDIGLVLGAILAASLAGSFAPDKQVDRKLVLVSVVGGLLLGYGARLAFGCNIGGLLAGISTGSLHGWLWLLAGFAGATAGVYIRIWIKIDKPIGDA